MLTPTSVKDALQRTAPAETVMVQGWVRTRRDAKDFSFLELHDGSCPRHPQVISKSARQITAVQRLSPAPSLRAPRSSQTKAKGKTGKWSRIRWRSSALQMTPILCKKKGTRRSFCAKSPTSVRVQTFSAAFSASGAGSLLRFTNFSRSAASFTSIRRSSPEATAKAPVNYFGSRRSTPRIRHACRTAKLMTRKISLPDGPT